MESSEKLYASLTLTSNNASNVMPPCCLPSVAAARRSRAHTPSCSTAAAVSSLAQCCMHAFVCACSISAWAHTYWHKHAAQACCTSACVMLPCCTRTSSAASLSDCCCSFGGTSAANWRRTASSSGAANALRGAGEQEMRHERSNIDNNLVIWKHVWGVRGIISGVPGEEAHSAGMRARSFGASVRISGGHSPLCLQHFSWSKVLLSKRACHPRQHGIRSALCRA